MRNFIAFMSMMMVMSVCAGEQGAWLYDGYKFEPLYGYGAQYGYKLFYQGAPFYQREYDAVARIVRSRYGYDKEEETRTGANNRFPYTAENGFYMGSFVEVKEGVFVFSGMVETNRVKGVLGCRDKPECPKGGFFAAADATLGNLRILDYPKDVIEKQGKYQNPVRVYGCYGDNPIHAGDINGDGNPEILYFSGYGKGQTDIVDAYFGEEDASYDLRGGLNLSIYSGEDYSARLLELNILHADYVLGTTEARLTGGDARKPRFHFFNVDKIKAGAPIEEWGAGYQIPAKIFVADIDQDNHMDILVWYRKYISKSIDDPDIGFEFDSERFERYEESSSGKFLPVSITLDDARQVMKEQKWSWGKGFPNKDYCDYSPSFPDKDPSLIYIDNEYGIGKIVDPIIQQ